jgi:DUF4097 and DUF4098 domain-containing protein YvlB
MFKKTVLVVAVLSAALMMATTAGAETRQFSASAGGTLKLDLETGGSVNITGGGAGIVVNYTVSGPSADNCRVAFQETGDGLEISTEYLKRQQKQSVNIQFDVQVPGEFNVKLDSMGGGLSIEGVSGTFTGKTMGGALILHDVRGKAKLQTMGGEIRLTDSELDGSLSTMGGEVLFENVFGDVKGSSMGGEVRYKNVERPDGSFASPKHLDHVDGATDDTVKISTMGGRIDIPEAPEGANLHTMGGDIRVAEAERFVKAKTMGGDIYLAAVDGWIDATTYGGDIEAVVTGQGGDVTLVSLSGDVTLHVPSDFGMDLDLEIAFTRNSSQDYRIETGFDLRQSVTPDWDHDHGSPRKYIRARGAVRGGGNRVRIETINGNIRIVNDQ